MKVTFELDDELYRAIKVEAARADRSVREIAEEALEAWRRDGGVAAEAWLGSLAAETRATYGSDPDR